MKTYQILLAAGIALISSSAFATPVNLDLSNTTILASANDVDNRAKGARSEAYQRIGVIRGRVKANNTHIDAYAKNVTNSAIGTDSKAIQSIGVIDGCDCD